jgi:hypothetical protein
MGLRKKSQLCSLSVTVIVTQNTAPEFSTGHK